MKTLFAARIHRPVYNFPAVRGLFGLFILTCSLVFIASGCSEKKEEQSATQSVAPPTNTQKKAPLAADNLPTSGKVVKAMHAGGYTYMEMESAGQQFWIAATMMNVKRNDHVSWRDAAVMKNFKSSSLHRTFDEILFVSSATVQ